MRDRSKPETKLQKAIVDALAAIGVTAVRVHSGEARVKRGYMHFAEKGTPDLTLVMFRSSWLETKMGSGGKLHGQQENIHRKFMTAGARVEVVRSVAGALATVGRWRSEDRELERLVEAERILQKAGL